MSVVFHYMGIKDRAIGLLARQLTKQALVLETRAWDGETFFEVDLHVPDANFDDISGVMHIKCCVAPFAYRDYNVAGWDAATKTCTLLIHAGHDGAGSAWAKTLKRHGYVSYVGIKGHGYPPLQQRRILLLGDQSAVGHFLAIQQLSMGTSQITGTVIIPDGMHRKQLKYFYPNLQLMHIPLQGSYSTTIVNWLQQQQIVDFDLVCIAGNTPMVVDARKQLKRMGLSNAQIKAEVFWK